MGSQFALLKSRDVNCRRLFSVLAITVVLFTGGVGQAQSDEVYDLVIVGGGFAGMGALRRASKLGLKVLLVEKSPQVGGVAVSIPSPAGNFNEDLGPQFILDHYTEIFDMIREA